MLSPSPTLPHVRTTSPMCHLTREGSR